MTTRRPSRIFAGLPPHGAGQAIGLMGGSFNPPHEGHRRIAVMALKRLALDSLWWLVTPGNPLKDVAALPPLDARMQSAAEIAAHPRIVISGAEHAFSTRYTADLIAILRKRAPDVRFVWVMGSDNLAQFHLWEDWRKIAQAIPIAVIGRPGFLAAGLSSRAARALGAWRIDEADASALAGCTPPAWTFLTGPRSAASSTELRQRGSPS